MNNPSSGHDLSTTSTLWATIECPQGQGVRTRLGPDGRPVPVRTLPPGIFYPYSYGYIEGTRVADGEELDVFVLAGTLPAGARVEVAPVGAVAFRDLRGDDPKVIAAIAGHRHEEPLARIAQRIGRFLVDYKSATEPRSVGGLLSLEETLAIVRAAQAAYLAEAR